MVYTKKIDRETLVIVAFELLEQEGIDAVSMRRLALALDVRASSLYHHFADKSALLSAVAEKGLHLLAAELEQARAWADPDARPFTPEERAKAKRVPRIKTLRRALGLTQEEFAARYKIPLGTLRDWEQGRTEPDQANRAYLKVIAIDPEFVKRALAQRPGGNGPRGAGSSRCASSCATGRARARCSGAMETGR